MIRRLFSFGVLFGAAALFAGGCDNTSEITAARPFSSTIVSAKSLSKHYVEVTFDGATGGLMASPEAYRIVLDEDAAPLVIRAAKLSDDANKVVLTTDAQREAMYRLTLVEASNANAVSAAATFPGSTATEMSLGYAVALSNTSILLSFSQQVDGTTSANVANYLIDNPDLKVLSAVKGAGASLWHTVTLTTGPQADQLYSIRVVNVTNSANAILVDPDENTAAFYGIARTDVTSPKLIKAVATSYTTVRLSFSEPLENFATESTNYVITPGVTVLGAQLNEYGTQVLLTTLPLTLGTPYTVAVSNVEDMAARVIDPLFSTAAFTFSGAITEPTYEGEGPRVVGAISINNLMVDVHFSKPMGPSAAVAEHYRITGPDTTFLFVEQAVLSTDRTTARLTTTSQADLLYTVQAAGVKDDAGNSIEPPSSSLLAIVGLDPTKANFFGSPPADIDEQIDTDGDGFADWFENAGWLITIKLANGGTKVAFVTTKMI